MHYITYYKTPIRRMLLAANENALVGAWFVGQKYYKATLNKECIQKDTIILQKAKFWLDEYFRGRDPTFTPPLEIIATPFRKEILSLVSTIPYGATISYKELSDRFMKEHKKKVSYQAVGQAVGHNPLLLFIPCHRVIGFDGSLKGYAAGVFIKDKLLNLEAKNIIIL